MDHKAIKDDYSFPWWMNLVPNFIISFFYNLKRSFSYAVFGWTNPDWDSLYLIELMEFKLLRIQKDILEGHHVPDKITSQSIRIAVKLCNKIAKERYKRNISKHFAKWGYPTFKTEEGRFMLERDIDPVLVDKEIEESLKASFLDEDSKKRDTRILFNILTKYYVYWWV